MQSFGESYQSLVCLPLDYGVGECKRHDENMPPNCNGENPPSYCFDAWCYVDGDACRTSTYKYFKAGYFSDRDYSYQSCGTQNSEYHNNADKFANLKGKTLSVALPQVNYPYMYLENYIDADGDYGRGDPESIALDGYGNDYIGISVGYLKNLANAMDFKLNFTYVSRGNLHETLDRENNKRYNGSNWKGCIYDVGQGIVDICVGDYWATADRVEIAPFSLPFFDEEWYVFSERNKKTTAASWTDLVKVPFAPFHARLWIALMLTAIYCALLHKFLVNSHDLENWKKGKSGNDVKLRSTVKTVFKYVIEFLTMSVDMDDEGSNQPNTNIGQGLLKISFTFISVMFISSYTANLAAMFVNTPVNINAISSVEDCIARNCNFCVHKHRVGFLENAYNNKTLNIIPFRNSGAMMDEMEQFGTGLRGTGGGKYYYADRELNQEKYNKYPWEYMKEPKEHEKCDTYMWSSKEFVDMFKPILCEYEFKSAPIYWLPISFPVSDKYSAGLSYAIRKFEETDSFSIARDEFFRDEGNSPTCDPFEQSDMVLALEQKTPRQLDWHHFAGPYVILIFATAVAVSHKIIVEIRFDRVKESLLQAGDSIGKTGSGGIKAMAKRTTLAVKTLARMGSDEDKFDMEMMDNPALGGRLSSLSENDSRDIRATSAANFSFDTKERS